jgi:hypothetical protein
MLISLRRLAASVLLCLAALAATVLGLVAVTSEAKAADYRHITSVSPSSGPTTGGTTVTISFQNGVNPRLAPGKGDHLQV